MSPKRVAVVVFLTIDDELEDVADLIAMKMVRGALKPRLQWRAQQHTFEGEVVGVQELRTALWSGAIDVTPSTMHYVKAGIATELPT